MTQRVSTSLMELVFDAQNLMASLREDIAERSSDLAKMLDEEVQQLISEQIEATSLAYVYINSIAHDVKDMLDHVRILDEVIDGRISVATFNTRYEKMTFGDET